MNLLNFNCDSLVFEVEDVEIFKFLKYILFGDGRRDQGMDVMIVIRHGIDKAFIHLTVQYYRMGPQPI